MWGESLSEIPFQYLILIRKLCFLIFPLLMGNTATGEGVGPPKEVVRYDHSIPNERYLKRLNYRKVEINGCNFTKLPRGLGDNTTLEDLDIAWSELRSFKVTSNQFVNLKRLGLSHNLGLTTFPPSICTITSLVSQKKKKNMIVDVPTEMSKLCQLRELNLNGNKIQQIPIVLSTLTNLESLSISTISPEETYFPEDFTFKCISSVVNLEIVLHEKSLLPSDVYSLQNLRHLVVSAHFDTAQLCTLPNLESLEIRAHKSYNKRTGSDIHSILGFSDIRCLVQMPNANANSIIEPYLPTEMKQRMFLSAVMMIDKPVIDISSVSHLKEITISTLFSFSITYMLQKGRVTIGAVKHKRDNGSASETRTLELSEGPYSSNFQSISHVTIDNCGNAWLIPTQISKIIGIGTETGATKPQWFSSTMHGRGKMSFIDEDGMFTFEYERRKSLSACNITCPSEYTRQFEHMFVDKDHSVWISKTGQPTIPFPLPVPPIAKVNSNNIVATLLDTSGRVWVYALHIKRTIPSSLNRLIDDRISCLSDVFPELPSISDVAIGNSALLLLDTNGFVWVYGTNTAGRLGINGHETFSFVKLEDIPPMQFVYLTPRCSIMIDQDWNIWASGEDPNLFNGQPVQQVQITGFNVRSRGQQAKSARK